MICVATLASAAQCATETDAEREAFNRRAVEHDVPIFWCADVNHNRRIDPDDLVLLWHRRPLQMADLFDTRQRPTAPLQSLIDNKRQAAGTDEALQSLQTELRAGRQVLVHTTLNTESDWRFYQAMARVAATLE